jgi:hypothetical protein
MLVDHNIVKIGKTVSQAGNSFVQQHQASIEELDARGVQPTESGRRKGDSRQEYRVCGKYLDILAS